MNTGIVINVRKTKEMVKIFLVEKGKERSI